MALRYTVQGSRASLNEWNFAQALTKLEIPFTFQYPVFGAGRLLRGSFKIDFVVYTPFAIPCEIQGERWHTGKFGRMDRWRMAIIRQKFGRDPVWFWGRETARVDLAMRYIKHRLHV